MSATTVRTPCTLVAFAAHKRLDPVRLSELRIDDAVDGLRMPCLDDHGRATGTMRVRRWVETAHPTTWIGAPMLFGLQSMRRARERGEVVFVEGESDQLTLREHGVPALGVPGASMTRLIAIDHVENIPRVFVIREPDNGGRIFVAAVAKRLREVGWTGELFIVDLDAVHGAKDPSALQIDGPERFPERWHTATQAAMPYAVAANTHNGLPEISLRCLAGVEPEEVEYLWKDRIAFGKVTLLVGDPGAGKSYGSLAIAAAVTRGTRLPGDDRAPCEPREVILCNYEDGAGDTIRPRAEAAEADVGQIHLIEGQRDDAGHVRPFELGDVPALIRELQRRPSVRVLIVDPLGSLLAGIDSHRDAEVRSALLPLFDLADQRKIAVVVVAHLNKAQAIRALYRVGGSIGFVGAARSVLLFGEDPESHRRAIAQLKNNLGPLTQPVEYAIDGNGFRFLGIAAELDAGRLLAPEKRPENAERKSEGDKAKTWLVGQLREGEALATAIEQRAVEAEISEATLRRARKALGVISHPHVARGPRFLRLPGGVCLAQQSRDAQGTVLSETDNLSETEAAGIAPDDAALAQPESTDNEAVLW